MAQSPSDWRGKVVANGRYLVRSKLGEGGMGYVFRAHDRNLDADVVIKVPRRAMLDDPEFAKRFAHEIRSLVKLAHPCVVKITDVGEEDGVPFAVMQYLSGGSLEDYRPDSDATEKGQAAANAAELSDWLPGIASALDFVHSQGYVHRDVKPGNILFDAHGHVFLSDFGVAKALGTVNEPDRHQAAQTGTGLVLGTPDYMAPELVMGRPFDGKIDQYALAVTVYEMLSGRRPFEGPNPTSILVKQTMQDPVPLCTVEPRVPKPLSDAVGRALSKNPEKRFPTCAAFSELLIASAAAGVGTSSPTSKPARADQVRLVCPKCGKNLILPARITENPELAATKRFTCPSCQTRLGMSEDARKLVPASTIVTPVNHGSPTLAATPSLQPPDQPKPRQIAATQIQTASAEKTLVTPSGFVASNDDAGNPQPMLRKSSPMGVWIGLSAAALFLIAATVTTVLLLPGLRAPNKGFVRIALQGVPNDAMITLDRQQYDPKQFERPLTLPIGDHVLAVISAKHIPFRKTFAIDGKQQLEFQVSLQPLPEPETPKKAEVLADNSSKNEEKPPPPPDPSTVPPKSGPGQRKVAFPKQHKPATYEPVPERPAVEAELARVLDKPIDFENKIVLTQGLFQMGQTASRLPDGTVTATIDHVTYHYQTRIKPAVLFRDESPRIVQIDPKLAEELALIGVLRINNRQNSLAATNWIDCAVVLTFHVQKRTDESSETWVPILKRSEFILALSFGHIGESKFMDVVRSLYVNPGEHHVGKSDHGGWSERLGKPYIAYLKRAVHEMNQGKMVHKFEPITNQLTRKFPVH